MRCLPVFLIVILFLSCNNAEVSEKNEKLKEIPNKYAGLFKISKSKSLTVLSVFDVKGNIAGRYYLLSEGVHMPDSLKDKVVIRTPVKNIVCLSTTHTAFVSALKEQESIKGVSGSKYIFDKILRSRIASGETEDVGFDASLNFELILGLNTGLVTVYDINGSLSPSVNKLKQTGIPVVLINEYSESSVLGQAEWIKFFACFFDKTDFANDIFSSTEQSYLRLKDLCSCIDDKPSVLLNMPWKGVWYVPGGKSNVAELIKDAGGNYLWSDTDVSRSFTLSIESVYEKGGDADFWLNPGQAGSLSDIIATDSRLRMFKVLQSGNVYNRNKRLSPGGGNDYMESGIVNPDVILRDLIKILHPEILKDDSLFYYKKLF